MSPALIFFFKKFSNPPVLIRISSPLSKNVISKPSLTILEVNIHVSWSTYLISVLMSMHVSNRFAIVCNIGIVIPIYKLNNLKFEVPPQDCAQNLEDQKLIPVGKVEWTMFLDILSTNKYFYHYCCVIFSSKHRQAISYSMLEHYPTHRF